MVTYMYLNENQLNVQCHRVGEIYFALTSCYSIAIYILTTRCCLVLLIIVKCYTPFILTKNAAQPPEDVPFLPLVHCRYYRSRDWGKTLPGQRTSTNTAQTRRESRARPSSTNAAQPLEDVLCLPLSTVNINTRRIQTGNTSPFLPILAVCFSPFPGVLSPIPTLQAAQPCFSTAQLERRAWSSLTSTGDPFWKIYWKKKYRPCITVWSPLAFTLHATDDHRIVVTIMVMEGS